MGRDTPLHHLRLSERGTYIQDREWNQFAIAEKGKQMLARFYAPPACDLVMMIERS
jgi:hypothetical protein